MGQGTTRLIDDVGVGGRVRQLGDVMAVVNALVRELPLDPRDFTRI